MIIAGYDNMYVCFQMLYKSHSLTGFGKGWSNT